MGLNLVIWVIVCLAPAAWEYRIIPMSSSWAESQASMVSIKADPSGALDQIISKKSGVLSETDLTYDYLVNGVKYTGHQHSLPHFDYFSHFPTELKDDFKTGSNLTIKYQLEDPKESVCPQAAGQFTVTALVQGVLACICGAFILLIWSVTRS